MHQVISSCVKLQVDCAQMKSITGFPDGQAELTVTQKGSGQSWSVIFVMFLQDIVMQQAACHKQLTNPLAVVLVRWVELYR
jgi:hypothetical protein